jgi:hypothetical protein
LAIKPAAADSIQISGVSGAVALSPVTLTNVSTVIIDAATNDRDGGNDSLTIHAEGGLPGGIGFLEYQSGVGTNTLAVHDGLVRIDATVAEGGLLNTTVGPGAGLVTHRLRQNELVLADDARATILSNAPGAPAPASVVESVYLGPGATLDITNNAFIIDYPGPSPLQAVRDKLLAGRGAAGLGHGAWTGTGITSSVAAMANAVEPEAWSVAFAENEMLQRKSFRGVAVDETALLIAFTRTGDANLDGVVNDEDVTIVNANYAPGVPTANWAAGDFEYDGFVDDDDITLLGAFYNPPGSHLRLAGSLPDRFWPSAHAAPTDEVFRSPVRRRRN